MLYRWLIILLSAWLAAATLNAQDCPDTRVLAISRGEKPSAASDPTLYSDGSGGYWMVFKMRGFEDTWNRLFVQRVSALGKPYFQEPGLPISSFPGDQSQANAIPTADGLGIVWRQSAESGLPGDIYLQNISLTGELLFDKSGLRVCANPANQLNPQVWSSAQQKEIYIAWEDERAGENLPSLFIQKVHSETGLAWAADGQKIATLDKPAKRPAFCEDTRGGVYIIWEDYRSGTGWQLYYQSYTPQGHPRYAGEGNQLLRPDASSQSIASAIPDGFGGFFFACEKMDVVNFESDIYFGKINHSGQLAYQYPACSAFGEQRNPKLAARTTEVIITWEDKRKGNWDVYGQLVSIRDGRPQWEFNGVPLADGETDQTHAGMFSTIEFNDILMTWAESDNILAQKFSIFGERLWETNGVTVCTEFSRQEKPVICRNGEGGAWIAWTDFREGIKVYYQHLNLNGQALQKLQGNTFIQDPENHTGTGIENLTSLQVNPDSTWVLWEDYRKGPNDPDVFLTKVSAEGISIFVDNGLPVCTEPGEQTRPQMISDGKGGIWVAWIDRRNNRDEDIYYQHISPGGFPYFPITGRVLVSAPRSQAQLQIKPDGKGGFWAVWTDARSFKDQGFDVFLQHVVADGSISLDAGGEKLCGGTQDSHTPVLAEGKEGSIAVLWLDNRNAYLNIWMQVLLPNGRRLFPGEGKAIAPGTSHQRQPAVTAAKDGWLIAWSDERYGQNRDKIFLLNLHASGQIQSNPEELRISSGQGRQQRPSFKIGEEGKVLIAWQESSEKVDEGVLVRCRIVNEENLHSYTDPGRLIARLTEEKEIFNLNWHPQLSSFLIGWIEQKTRRAAAWTMEPHLRGAIPDNYQKACDSRFEQHNVKILPYGKNQAILIWSETKDTYQVILQRIITVFP